MTVVCVLVEAVVGDQDEVVADFVAEGSQCDLHHAVAGVGTRPDGILGRRHAEEHHRGDPEVGEGPHLLAEALLRVLEHARHRRHWFGRVDPLLHEERRDQIVDADACLADEAAQRGSSTQPPRSMLGKRHAARVLPGARRSAPDGAYAPA